MIDHSSVAFSHNIVVGADGIHSKVRQEMWKAAEKIVRKIYIEIVLGQFPKRISTLRLFAISPG